MVQDEAKIQALLIPREQAHAMFELLGATVFDILLKGVLGRGRMATTRAVETDKGRFVHIEFVWPDPELADGGYTAADLVTVKLRRYRKDWRVVSINPAAVDFPLTEARAHGVLVTSKALSDQQKAPAEPWMLPVALFGGSLQMPLRPSAMKDGVEKLLLPGLQHRTYGILSLIAGRRLWRDFRKRAKPQLDSPEAWASAAEFIMSEQTMREATQGAVATQYQVALAQMLPRVKRMKQALGIKGVDGRYSPLSGQQIVLSQELGQGDDG